MDTIKITESDNLTWVNITNPGPKEMGFLASNFSFHPLDLKDCRPPLQRPKLVARDNYLFMILQFPVYNKQTKEVFASEIDFFILPNYVVTVHSNEIEPIIELLELCQKDKDGQEKLFEGSFLNLLYRILDQLTLYPFPMLNHINLDIDNVEKKIFTHFDRETVRETLNIKRNIVNFRKSMQAHKNVLKKLIEKSRELFSLGGNLEEYYFELIENTKEIWDLLENYKDSINALYETHDSLSNFRLSNIMKTLTIFSVIVFPLTLLAAIFGMNTLGSMPFANHPFGFWLIILIMVIGSSGMYVYFKKKDWI